MVSPVVPQFRDTWPSWTIWELGRLHLWHSLSHLFTQVGPRVGPLGAGGFEVGQTIASKMYQSCQQLIGTILPLQLHIMIYHNS